MDDDPMLKQMYDERGHSLSKLHRRVDDILEENERLREDFERVGRSRDVWIAGAETALTTLAKERAETIKFIERAIDFCEGEDIAADFHDMAQTFWKKMKGE